MQGNKWLLVTIAVLLPLASCGHKAKLKTPDQAQADEAKKAKKRTSSSTKKSPPVMTQKTKENEENPVESKSGWPEYKKPAGISDPQ